MSECELFVSECVLIVGESVLFVSRVFVSECELFLSEYMYIVCGRICVICVNQSVHKRTHTCFVCLHNESAAGVHNQLQP